MIYNFEWNPGKAKQNLSKHSVSFELAATIFKDPRAISIYDEVHSDEEERWVTIGLSQNGNVLVVVHTFDELKKDLFIIRIISARKTTKKETKQYLETES